MSPASPGAGPDDAATREVIVEFRRRRTRQWIASGLAVAAIFGAFLGDAAISGKGGGLSDHPLAIAGFVVVLGVLVFSLRNWRCPKCNAYLGKRMAPRFCSSCGAQLAP